MGPKAKGKNKKKSKAKKLEGAVKPQQLTFKEAVLNCRIKAIQNQIENVESEKSKVIKRNEKQKERNEALKQEQELHVQNAVAQAKELNLAMDRQPKVDKDEVETRFHEYLDEERQQEEEIKEIKRQITRIEEAHEKVLTKIERLREYKEVGQYEDSKWIQLMKQEMEEIDESYEVMQENVSENLKTAKDSTRKLVLMSIERQKDAASALAMKGLSLSCQQEFMDHKWLLKEVEIHEQQREEMQVKVDELEAANLKIIASMLDERLLLSNQPRLLAIEGSASPLAAEDGMKMIEWIPQGKTDEELDNYLEYPAEDDDDDPSLLHEEAQSLFIRGYSMAIEVKEVDDEDVTNLPTFPLWSKTQLPSDHVSAT